MYNGELNIPGVRHGPPTDRIELVNEGLRKDAIEVLSNLVHREGAGREEITLLGDFLYDLLFQGEIRDQFLKTYEAVTADEDCVLRLVLEFKGGEDFSELPWEYLHLTDLNVFAAAVSPMVLSRHVELKKELKEPDAPDQLRLLAVVSNPSNARAPVIAAPIVDKIRKMSEAHRLDVRLLEQPTRKSFEEAFRDRDWRPQILHFFGHGQFDPVRGGSLALCKPMSEREDWLPDDDLVDILGERRRLRLVVLQSCEGAAGNEFSGVANKLVRAAVPAVVAMRYEIDNDSATCFAETFYRRLDEGWPIDSAVQAGREALVRLSDDARRFSDRRFGTPVLFLQSRDYQTDHRLIRPSEEGAQGAEASGASARDQAPRAVHVSCPYCGNRSSVIPGRSVYYCSNDSCRSKYRFCPSCGDEVIPSAEEHCDECLRLRVTAAAAGQADPDRGERGVTPAAARAPHAPADDRAAQPAGAAGDRLYVVRGQDRRDPADG